MISQYSQCRHGKYTLALFEQIQDVGLKPKCINLVGIISACSHIGLVDEDTIILNP